MPGAGAEGGLQGSVHSLLVLPGSPAAGRGCSGSGLAPLPPLPTDETEAPPWRCPGAVPGTEPQPVLCPQCQGSRCQGGCGLLSLGPWHPHAVPGLAPWQFQTPSPSHGVPSLHPRALLAEGLVPSPPGAITSHGAASLIPGACPSFSLLELHNHFATFMGQHLIHDAIK